MPRSLISLTMVLALLAVLASTALTQPPAPAALAEEAMPVRCKPMLHSARLGAEWLFQAHEADGRFRMGVNPLLNLPLPDEGYLAQAEATLTLAQAARCFGEERLEVRAKQALLSLLAQTKTDAQHPNQRYTQMPGSAVNRPAAAALLVRAIQELREPGPDLLEQSEQLCNYLRTLQQPDGSFIVFERVANQVGFPPGVAFERALPHGNIACALALSHRRQPAAWKQESIRKLAASMRSQWNREEHAGALPGCIMAIGQVYQQTRDRELAVLALEMSDAIAKLQVPASPSDPMAEGGFGIYQLEGAVLGEGLVSAMILAKDSGDPTRSERLRAAAERFGQHLVIHQFTPANTSHFAEWYQKQITGSFFRSTGPGCNSFMGSARATRFLLCFAEGVAEPRK